MSVVKSEVKRFLSGVDIIDHAAKLTSYRQLMVFCYENLKHRDITRIEKLTEEEKNEIWANAKQYNTILDRTGLIELSKVIYLISQYLPDEAIKRETIH